jgi:short-subunit dehydrogenase involved in D-alanine esterification of teichoic acids
MQLDSNTILITGGASGIGLAMAQRFLKAGSEVIVCGRDESKLRAVREAHHGLKTIHSPPTQGLTRGDLEMGYGFSEKSAARLAHRD